MYVLKEMLITVLKRFILYYVDISVFVKSDVTSHKNYI